MFVVFVCLCGCVCGFFFLRKNFGVLSLCVFVGVLLCVFVWVFCGCVVCFFGCVCFLFVNVGVFCGCFVWVFCLGVSGVPGPRAAIIRLVGSEIGLLCALGRGWAGVTPRRLGCDPPPNPNQFWGHAP